MNFKKKCIFSDLFLKENKDNIFLNAISSAHVLKKHPVFPSIDDKKNNKLSKNFTKNFKKTITYLYDFFCEKIFFFRKKKIKIKKDILIVSNLVNKNHLKRNEDFYFGDISKLLNKKKISHSFALRNLTNLNYIELSKSINNKKNKFILSKTFHIHVEIYLVALFIKNFFYLNFLNFLKKNNEKNNFVSNFYKFDLMKTSLANIRHAYQILYLVKSLNSKIVLFTYEGHAWERILIKLIKKNFGNNVKLIGYQFSALNKYSHSIFKKRGFDYDPDYILTSGVIPKKMFEKSKVLNQNNIINIGSFKNKKKNKNLKKNFRNILVLPEGFLSETNILIDYVKKISSKNKNFNFIFRLHPLISLKDISHDFSNYKNILFSSNKSLATDMLKCEFVFYRGSSAVFECIFNKIHPIYIDNNDGINVDPLFFIKKTSKLYSNNSFKSLDSFLKNEKKKFYKISDVVDKFYSKSNFENFYHKVLKDNM